MEEKIEATAENRENSFDISNIMQRSEEVQVIIDRMPTKWTKYIAFVTFILVCIVLFLSFLISYPDTVSGNITITQRTAPVRIVANKSGRLHLLKLNKSKLKRGDVIAYIECGANYSDILLLDSLLKDYKLNKDIVFPFDLTVGDVAGPYNTFLMAYKEYNRLIQSDLYTPMGEVLKEQIATNKSIICKINLEESLKKKILTSANAQLKKEQSLLSIKAVTEDEYIEMKQTVLSRQEELINIENNRISKMSEISHNKLEIKRLSIEKKDNIEKAKNELSSAHNALINALLIWKEQYVQYAVIDGELEYLGFWRENNFINSGCELFSIIPRYNDAIGEAIIPSYGAGKVAVNQIVNVKINNYPYDEYGLIKGKVSSIAFLTNNIETEKGKIETYRVGIIFPYGFVTNFGLRLPINVETKGSVEIITKRKRLIERLFDNLKARKEK